MEKKPKKPKIIKLKLDKIPFDDILFSITTQLPNYKLAHEIDKKLETNLAKTDSSYFDVYHWRESVGDWLLVANKRIEQEIVSVGVFENESQSVDKTSLLEQKHKNVDYWLQIPGFYKDNLPEITEKLKQIKNINTAIIKDDNLLHNFLILSTNYAYK